METSISVQPTPADAVGRKKVLIASILFMGLGHIVFLKQYLKGIFFAALEAVFVAILPRIIKALINLQTLGEPKPHLPVRLRDNSIFMLIDGVVVVAMVAVFIAIYIVSVRDALNEYHQSRSRRVGIRESINNAFPVLGLGPSIGLIVFFVIVPLVFSACVAFTNYSSPLHIPPNNTVDWVGLDNFRALFGGSKIWTQALGRVAAWTLIWGGLATATCYFGGMLMAVVLRDSRIKIAPIFRTIFILPYAIPSVVSMLVWQNLLNATFGTVNRTLRAFGIISTNIPWIGDPTWAKFTAVMINLWAGFPYFMLLITGSMSAISQDIFEAAEIDGASRWQVFRKIVLPIVIYQTAPLIIMSFTHNVNNFGAIFFLTGGGPVVSDTTTTNAAGTDILVTWIYKLTVNLNQYHYASVLAAMIFLVLAPIAILNLRRTRSFREGEL
jgi:arabinogalactan oligomer/maltooligosaccharide transport system permease protein